jgi:DNA-binding NtrC family response regulator
MTTMARVVPMHPMESPPPALLLAFPRPGDRPSQRRPIPRAGLLLGRGEKIFDEPFDDPAMAPRHAEIQLQGKHAMVNDLGSGAGTRLNGATLSASRALVEGDVLRLGDTMFVYTSRERLPAGPGKSTAEEPELTGSTPSIEAVRRSVEAVARHPRSVVVTGETGTGKEIVSRLLHRRSERKGPFVAVNCGGFTEGLLASELFGHVRGAFTGAVGDQQGIFRAAQGGTLLLDEVGEIPMALQPTLLRVLDTWKVRPVGSTRDVPVDVRVIAASNRELVTLVRQGLFRPDLYARLAQWIIRLPPLRDRREDIPALSRALLGQLGAADRSLAPDLEEALLVHPWPLNVRGLSNVLTTALIASPPDHLIQCGTEVRAALDDNRIGESESRPDEPPVAYDRTSLEGLLHRFEGRVAEMARHVGVSRPKMYRMLWSVDLDPAGFRAK